MAKVVSVLKKSVKRRLSSEESGSTSETEITWAVYGAILTNLNHIAPPIRAMEIASAPINRIRGITFSISEIISFLCLPLLALAKWGIIRDMRFLSASVLLSMIFALGVLVTPAGAETFAVNLTVGSRGSDVTALQQFLVAKGYLQMPAGVSYGHFGPLTKAAVARWQVANGISPAVGYFGPISRAAIASQMATSPVSPVPNPNLSPSVEIDTPSALGMRVNRIMLFRATPFEVRPGDFATLDGSGFSKTSNKVYFNGGNLIIGTSTDGTTLKISVPASLAEGEYKLSVSNALGSSDNPDVDVVIKVTNNPEPGPTIESASITGDTVTIIGRGFTSANNLFTTLGDSSSPISSNGTTLTFRVTDLSRYNQIKQFTLGKYQVALWIYVQNEHGINKEPYKLGIII